MSTEASAQSSNHHSGHLGGLQRLANQTEFTSESFDARKAGTEMLSNALAPVGQDLSELAQVIASFLPAETDTAKSVVQHVFAAGGKRVRPAMYFMACRLTGYSGPHLMRMGAVCEYVHTASLLHDDVVDSSVLRRNRPTANTIWGDEASVLVGDLIYARASEMMADTGELEIVRTFARAIRLMSEGELHQLENVFDSELCEKRYLRIIECKTAVLVAAACKTAGLLSGLDNDKVEALSRFGSSVGMAFQLVDDALDYLGCREIFGKPTLSDLPAGKITLPVILLAESMLPEERLRLKKVVAQELMGREDVRWVAELVERYDTATKTIEAAQGFTDRAISALACFEDSEAKQNLIRLAETLVWRFT